MRHAAALLGLSVIWTLQGLHAQPVTTHVDIGNSVISYSGEPSCTAGLA